MKILITLICCLSTTCIAISQQSLSSKIGDIYNQEINFYDTINQSLIVHSYETYYEIQHSIDTSKIILENVVLNYQHFTNVSIRDDNNYSTISNVGFPQLPFKNISLLVPSDMYKTTVSIEDFEVEYTDYVINNNYLPYQDWYENTNSTFAFNTEYYTQQNSLNNYYEIKTKNKIRNATILNLNIFPIQYNPSEHVIRIASSISFKIKLKNKRLSDISLFELIDAKKVVDVNFWNDRIVLPYDPTYKEKMLIVYSKDEFRQPLLEFADYKMNKNLNVEVRSIYEIQSLIADPSITNTTLRDYLMMRLHSNSYNNTPHYLLIVDDYSIIPPSYTFVGQGENYYTDIYYSCLEDNNVRQEDNFYPEILVGRWPVDNVIELQECIKKTIAFENNVPNNQDLLKTMLLSGTSNETSYNSDKFNMIKSISSRMNYNNFLNINIYDGRNYINDSIKIRNELKQHMLTDLWLFVYAGHGGKKIIGDPILLRSDNIKNYYYSIIPPVAMSFACNTHNLIINSDNKNKYCYGRTWLTTPNAGGVLHYGAASRTYSNFNKELALLIFDKISPDIYKNISKSIQIGLGNFYSKTIGNNDDRLRQVEKYSIFGDPSLLLYGGNNPTYYTPTNNQISEENKYEGISSINDIKDVNKIIIRDLQGKILFEYNTILNFTTDNLPEGIYIVTMFNKTQFYSYKIIVKH